MTVQWQKIVFWLVMEVTLTLLGYDDLADYSEFIFEQQVPLVKSNISHSLILV